ncbi:MAG: polysaccharide biosynthesis tyrosine autokinase [Actinomycetota bacterium]
MEPKDFFRVILRRRRSVITAMMVVVGVASFFSMRKEPTYAASCKVRIAAVGPGGGSQISDDPKKDATEIYASFEEMQQILQAPQIATKVAERMDVPFERAINRIKADHEQNTGIFTLTAVDSDAAFAAKLCDTYMVQFLADRVAGATAKVEGRKQVLQAQIDEFQIEIDNYTVLLKNVKTQTEFNHLRLKQDKLVNKQGDLEEQIINIETALKVTLGGGGEVISNAGQQGLKVGPDHKRDAILGLIVGLIFGAGLALVREYMDDTVRDKEAALRDIGLPVLASIPSARSDGPFSEDDGGGVEAARMLRTNLTSQGLGADVRCLVVTSTLSKRSAATLANLSGAIAEAGRTVLVLGADFRNARVHEAFGVGNAVGLTNVIRGQVTFEKAIRPVPGQAGVYVMPSGPVIGNPGELLSTEEMAMVIRRARKWADIVLIDAPPVLAAADASVLGTYADGVLMVMSAGQTPRAQASEAKDQLKAAGARLLGAVMFGASDPNGKVLALPFRRGDGGDDLPPLSPYGGDFGGYDGGGYGGGSFGGYGGNGGNGGYGAGAYGGGFGYGGLDDTGFDDAEFGSGFDDEGDEDLVAAPRSRPAPRAKARRPRGPQKKIVAAGTPARVRREDKQMARAPRRPSQPFNGADEDRARTTNRASASNGTRSNGRSAATGGSNGRSTQQRASNGRGARSSNGRVKRETQGPAARPARRPYDQDLF